MERVDVFQKYLKSNKIKSSPLLLKKIENEAYFLKIVFYSVLLTAFIASLVNSKFYNRWLLVCVSFEEKR